MNCQILGFYFGLVRSANFNRFPKFVEELIYQRIKNFEISVVNIGVMQLLRYRTFHNFRMHFRMDLFKKINMSIRPSLFKLGKNYKKSPKLQKIKKFIRNSRSFFHLDHLFNITNDLKYSIIKNMIKNRLKNV